MKFLTNPTPLKCISYGMIALLLFYSTACHYFKYRNVPPEELTGVNGIGSVHNYFVIHSGHNYYSLSELSADSTYLSGHIELATKPIYYKDDRKYRIKKYERDILHEVHFYLKDSTQTFQSGNVDIPLTEIREIRIIEKDKGKTIASHIFGTLGVIVGIMVIIGIIAALTKSSCPYIYVNDGEAYVFSGEIYGGAFAKNLEREDYMPLPQIKPINGHYGIRISNELKEKQYTDFAHLLVVDHPDDQRVLMDKTGQPHLLSNIQLPTSAISNVGEDLLNSLSATDSLYHLFNDISDPINKVILKFNKPTGINTGKLVVNAKNSLWIDYLIGDFFSKFGGSFDRWMEQQSQIPSKERLQKMLDNHFPLSVYVKKNGEWQLVDYLSTVGPLAARDFVIPIDLYGMEAEEIEVKIETGFMFWEMDFAGMDFSDNSQLVINRIKPESALGTGQNDWTEQLSNHDGNYMAQLEPVEVTEIIFQAPELKEDLSRGVFLHCSGYYELVRDYSGFPEITQLKKFKQPDYFAKYSKELYLKALTPKNELVLVNPVND